MVRRRELEMPVLKPIPIPTKEAAYLKALWRWITRIRQWELMEDWRHTLPDGTKIVIPAGLVFDGASIPRIFWTILSPTGLLLIPGLIHDFGYRYDFLLADPASSGEKYEEGKGRRFWDGVFRDVAIEVNGFKIINRIAWLALRIGGWLAWGKRRNGAAEPYWPVVTPLAREAHSP